MQPSEMIDRKDFKKFQNRFSLNPMSSFTLKVPQSFADVVNIAVPFYKQIDELLKREVDFSNKKDVEIITRLLTSQEHSKKDIQVLKKAFGELKFFKETQQNLPANEYAALIKELKCERFDQFETVFNYDDFGYKYYIILKGSVNVLLPNPEMLKKDKIQTHVQNNAADKKQVNEAITQQNQQKGNEKLLSSRKKSVLSSRKQSIQINSQITNEQAEQPSPRPVKKVSVERRKSIMKTQQTLLANHLGNEEEVKHVKKNSTQLISDFFQGNNDNHSDQQPGILSMIKSKSCQPQKMMRRGTLNQPNLVSGIKKLQMLLNKGNTIEEEETEPQKDEQLTDQQIQNTILQLHLGFDVIKALKVGDAFGEIALMNNARRTASIVCREESIMVTLSKQSYDKILANYHQKKFMESVNFLKEFSFFSNWQNSKINALYQNMEKRSVQYKEIVYKEGEGADYVYFIKEGEFEVTKSLKLDVSDSTSLNQVNSLMKSGKQWDNRTVKISVLGVGCSFGEEEIVMGIKRGCRVTCISSTGSLYILSKQKFIQNTKHNKQNIQKLKADIQNRVQWRENLQDRLIETEKKFKEQNNFLRPDSININDFKLRSSEQIHLESDSEDEVNITATSPLHKKRSLIPTATFNGSSPYSDQSNKRLSILLQRGSQLFHQHPIEQLLTLKEENARTLNSPMKSQTNCMISLNENESQTQDKQSAPPHVPLIKIKSPIDILKSASLTTDNSPIKGAQNAQKLINSQGQRISQNGHFVSSLTDLELDFTKLTMHQTKSPQIKNLIDPFYEPPNYKTTFNNIKQNVTLNKFSPKKGYTQTKFTNSQLNLPFFNEKINQSILQQESEQVQQEIQQNKSPTKIPKQWQNLLKYTTYMSNVKDKESLYNLNNFQSLKAPLSNDHNQGDINMIRVNSLRYSGIWSNSSTQDVLVSNYQSPRDSDNNGIIPLNSVNRSTSNHTSFLNNNYSITANSFTHLNSNNLTNKPTVPNQRNQSILLQDEINKSFNKQEDLSPSSQSSPVIVKRQHLKQLQLKNSFQQKFQNRIEHKGSSITHTNTTCPSIDLIINPYSTANSPLSTNKHKHSLGQILLTQSSQNSPQASTYSGFSSFKQSKNKSLLQKSQYNNQHQGAYFTNEELKNNGSFRIKLGLLNPKTSGSATNLKVAQSLEQKSVNSSQKLKIKILNPQQN